ncbi:MAG: DUF4236 domain-containing protein [Aristaeellaceae bacterium]
MGFRFRKSVKLGKHTRINLSKSGVGVSTGVKGFRVGVGPRGVRTTASIPGTGVSYTKQHSLKGTQKKRAENRVPVNGREVDGKIVMEVYGEKVAERKAGKPMKPMTKQERKKGIKIARKHEKAERKAARASKRGGCLGALVATLGTALLVGMLIAL